MNTQDEKATFGVSLNTQELKADAARVRTIFEDLVNQAQIAGGRIDSVSKKLNATMMNTVDSAFSQQLTKIKAQVKTLQREIADIRSGAYSIKPGEDVVQLLKEKTKSLKETEGIRDLIMGVGGKTATDAYKLNQTHIGAQQQFKERLVEAALETGQALIDIKEEGYEKEMAQIQLNYSKKIIAIELWERAQRKTIEDTQKAAFVANGGTEYQFVFNPDDQSTADDLSSVSSVARVQRTVASVQSTNEETRLLNNLKQQWLSWGNEYQTIENKITKVKADAAKARKDIDTQYQSGKINLLEASTAMGRVDAGEEAQLKPLNTQKNKLSASWLSMFRDLDGLSNKEIRKLIDQINKELSSQTLSTADTSALLEQLNKVKQFSVQQNPFAAWAKSFGEIKTATQTVELARRKLDQVKQTGSEQEIAEAEKAKQEAEEQLALAKDRRAASTSKSLSDISSVAGATSNLLKTFGVESPAVDGVMNSLSALASIDFKNPVSIITGGINAIASLLGGIFGETDLSKEKEIQSLQKQIDTLEESYATLEDSISKAYSQDASTLIKDQNELLEEQKELINDQITTEQSKKNGGDEGKLTEWQNTIKEIDKTIADNQAKAVDVIFGSDVQSAIDDFASAYVDAWGAGEDRAASQKEVVKKMIQGIVTELIKSNIADKVAALRTALKDAVLDGVIDDTEQAAIDKLQEGIYAQSEQDAKAYEKWLKGDEKGKNEDTFTGAIRGSVATEASVAELGGLFRSQTDSLLRIDEKIGTGLTSMVELAKVNSAIELNTSATATNTAKTVESLNDGFKAMQVELVAIKNNTSKDTGSYGN